MRKFTRFCKATALSTKQLVFLALLGCMMSVSLTAIAAQSVSGVVVDEKSLPMPGVVVQINGTTSGSITDQDGAYSIDNVEEGQELYFQFVGYKPQTIAANKSVINVTLEVDALKMDEVVVVGFGSQKKVNLTGAVAVAGEEVFEARPVTDVSSALQGAVPGLYISNNSGNLNSESSITVRGQGTIDAGSSGSPLVLIDGMEGDMNTLNPQDIASVSVLKDAAASSIYGSRAPFGVILITTKKGKTGKMSVNYNNSFRFSKQMNVPESSNSAQWASLQNDGRANGGQTPFIEDYKFDGILAWLNHEEGATNMPTSDGVKYKNGANSAYDNVDWYDVLNKDWTFGQEHTLTLNGGSEKQQVYASLNYLDQDGFAVYGGGDNYTRIATNLRATGEIYSWLKYNYSFKFQRADFEEPSFSDIIDPSQAKYSAPTMPLYDPNGNLANSSALFINDGGSKRYRTDRLYQQFQVVATPVKGWNVTAEVNYRLQTTKYHKDEQLVFFKGVDGVTEFDSKRVKSSSVIESDKTTNYMNYNVFSDYSYSINDAHNFKVMVGLQAEESNLGSFSAKRDGLIISGMDVIDVTTGTDPTGGAVTPDVSGSVTDWSTVGVFGRLNYDYKGRYLLEANLRYDGTSRFKSDKRWNWFPSFSAGWNIANEKFWEDYKKYVSVFKIRGSYGELGNQNTNNLYPTYAKMPTGTADGKWLIGGVQPNTSSIPALLNTELTWETIKTTNIGFDVAALRNRLNVSFDWFKRSTEDMVGPSEQLPMILGIDVPDANNTDMMSKGWEFSARWNDRTKGGFGYSVGFQISDYQSTVTTYPNTKGLLQYDKKSEATGTPKTYYSGMKLGEIWGYQTISMARDQKTMDNHLASLKATYVEKNGSEVGWTGQQLVDGGNKGLPWGAGDIMYRDLNGDGVITESSSLFNVNDQVIIGNSTPRYSFGMNMSANYKGFDMSMFWQGVMKRDYAMSAGSFFAGNDGGNWNMNAFTSQLDYFRPEDTESWLGPNTDGYLPRPMANSDRNTEVQSGYLLDASYIRLKNLQVGYTFNSEMFGNTGIKNVRLFMSAENVWTGCSLPEQFDPETIDGGNYGLGYPLKSTISFGINANF